MAVQSHVDVPSPTADASSTPRRMPRYALALLVAIYVLNNLDRQIINILAEPIRLELHLHDWQIGMMTGLSFGLFYATLGIPIARLAERGNRARIIAVSVIVWSGFTAVCGLAQTFIQLILARVGVGVGEAGCTPAAHSLISDMAPREKRASALGIYSMGGPLGALLGLAIGGLLIDLWGWRSGFLVAAAPGVVLGVLAAFTLNEPRTALKPALAAAEAAPTLRDAFRELRACRTFWLFSIGCAFQAMVAYGTGAFMGSFFFRNHGAELGQIAATFGLKTAGFLGLAIGLISGISGMVGAFAGGKLADRHAATNPRAIATQVAFFNFLAVPVYVLILLVGSAKLALALMVIPALSYGLTYGPMFSVFQSVVQPRTRATAVAIYLLLTNLIGLGVGPLLVGILSDNLAHGAHLGAAAGVRWALVAGSSLGLVAAALYWRARRHIARETVS
jgi:MFS family permease